MPALSTLKRNFYLTALGLPDTSKLDLSYLERAFYASKVPTIKGTISDLRRDYFKSLGYNSDKAYYASLGYNGSLSTAEYLYYLNGPGGPVDPGGAANLGAFDLGTKNLGAT